MGEQLKLIIADLLEAVSNPAKGSARLDALESAKEKLKALDEPVEQNQSGDQSNGG